MEDKAIQFLEKLDGLSDEAKLYFNSAIEAKALKEIQKDYQLSSDELDNIIYDVFIANFDFKVLDEDLKKTKVPESSRSKLAADILGKIFLAPATFLKLDVKNEIIKRSHRPEIYQDYEIDFNDLIEEKNFEAIEDVAALHESTFNPIEEEAICLDLFSKDIKGVLNNPNADAISELNGGLITLLTNKPDFHNKINKILFANQEVITTQDLTWPEGIQPGTVANWLKDFIKENGSDIYNSVVLSKYLATSANPQHLSEDERKVVRRLLRLYRNLVFFPESMNDVPMEDWEIIPTEKVAIEKPAPVKEEEKLPEVKEEAVVAPIEKKLTPMPLAVKPEIPIAKNSPVVETPKVEVPEIKEDPELTKLKTTLAQYAPDSLEAKVIREEIRKRQNN